MEALELQLMAHRKILTALMTSRQAIRITGTN
ncbi:hypothetical protein N185_35870 [Sinorhizobium sp. GW3]|nr:hypothetical protein N185_35870 [Sinorhizobium sp. GW3]